MGFTRDQILQGDQPIINFFKEDLVNAGKAAGSFINEAGRATGGFLKNQLRAQDSEAGKGYNPYN